MRNLFDDNVLENGKYDKYIAVRGENVKSRVNQFLTRESSVLYAIYYREDGMARTFSICLKICVHLKSR